MAKFKIRVGNVTISGGDDWHLSKYSITVHHGNGGRPVYVVSETSLKEMIESGNQLCSDLQSALEEAVNINS